MFPGQRPRLSFQETSPGLSGNTCKKLLTSLRRKEREHSKDVITLHSAVNRPRSSRLIDAPILATDPVSTLWEAGPNWHRLSGDTCYRMLLGEPSPPALSIPERPCTLVLRVYPWEARVSIS